MVCSELSRLNKHQISASHAIRSPHPVPYRRPSTSALPAAVFPRSGLLPDLGHRRFHVAAGSGGERNYRYRVAAGFLRRSQERCHLFFRALLAAGSPASGFQVHLRRPAGLLHSGRARQLFRFNPHRLVAPGRRANRGRSGILAGSADLQDRGSAEKFLPGHPADEDWRRTGRPLEGRTLDAERRRQRLPSASPVRV